MKLSYRGVNYDFNPSSLQARGAKHRLTEVSKARALGAILTYRGANYAIEPSKGTPANVGVSTGVVLTYRGQSYIVQPVLQGVPAQTTVAQPSAIASVKAPTISIQEQARALTMSHHRAMKKRQQVMLVRSAAEVGMATTTASHWERIQETFNPAFQATYDRSHVALS